MKEKEFSNKLFTVRRNEEWDEMISYLSAKLFLNNSSVVRLAVTTLYNQYYDE